MAIEYIKKAAKTSATGEDNTRDVVVKMLTEIEAGGEEKALEYAKQLDGWEGGNPVMTREQIDAAIAKFHNRKKMISNFPTIASANLPSISAIAWSNLKPN